MGNPKIEALRKKLIGPKAVAVQRVLQSEDGKLLIGALEEEFFNGDLLGKSPEETAFNLGAREIVRYLHRLRAFADREKDNG